MWHTSDRREVYTARWWEIFHVVDLVVDVGIIH